MNLKALVLVGSLIGIVTMTNAQRYKIQNGIGLYGGLTQFDIETNDFVTDHQKGWLVGAAATVDLPHKWYNVSYNIQLGQHKFGVVALPVGSSEEESVDYKIFTAQLALLGHLKLIGKHLTIDAGPMLQYNSELELQDDSSENYIVSGYNTVRAQDITDISNFNVNGAVGLTAGFDHFYLRVQYIYGFTNMLKKLNDQNLPENSEFKGNQSMLIFSAQITF